MVHSLAPRDWTAPPIVVVAPNGAAPEAEENARSMFGTRQYWDDVYQGRGDLPADTYSWYSNWNELQRHVQPFLSKEPQHILLPGIGNDGLLVDLLRATKGRRHVLVAQDYSIHALQRQIELLQEAAAGDRSNQENVQLVCSNVMDPLPFGPSHFDIILEKGLLDAVYLSDHTTHNVQAAISNLQAVLRVGGIGISVSSVIPAECRMQWWPTTEWEWIRDGHADATKAGCFIFRKLPVKDL